MSFYNMINGASLDTFFILPMLGKHPDEYPRFRDCFTSDETHPEFNDHIHVYTRVGSCNRGCGYNEEELYKHPNYVSTFDDSFDSTFATYVFSVPEQFKEDFALIKDGKIKNISDNYRSELYRVFPKLKDIFDEIFNTKSES
jgi:hypothetical protein